MKVSVVIPNWNGEEKLKLNLPAVMELKVLEVIVSDDNSTDNSVKLIEENFPQIKLIKRKVQGGFSTNVNEGVSQTSGDLIFLLNTDAIPNPECLKYALPHFEKEKVFSVSCSSGGSYAWAKFDQGYFWHFMADKVTDSHQTLWSSGGSGIFRKKIWEELGGLDNLFNPFYEEDVDLGYRATKRGYINIFEPRSKVEHYKEIGVIAQNYSQTKVARVAQRNQLFLIWKNIHDHKMIRQHLIYLAKRLITQPKYWLVFLSAFIHLPAILSERRVEKKAAKLTDQEVLTKFS